MAGTGKKAVWHDYQVAFEAVWRGLEELDKPVLTKAGNGQTLLFGETLPSKGYSPEEIAIKKDAYTRLSSDAREIFDIIVEAPAEIINALKTPKYNKISVRKFSAFLKEGGWSCQDIENCFSELREFLSVIDN